MRDDNIHKETPRPPLALSHYATIKLFRQRGCPIGHTPDLLPHKRRIIAAPTPFILQPPWFEPKFIPFELGSWWAILQLSTSTCSSTHFPSINGGQDSQIFTSAISPSTDRHNHAQTTLTRPPKSPSYRLLDATADERRGRSRIVLLVFPGH